MIQLEDFKRPNNDNGRGIHWSPSPYWDSSGKENWGFWKEQLLEMQIKWVKVICDGADSALPLVRRLVDIDIMPVVRFYWPEQNPGNLGDRGAKAVGRLPGPDQR